MGYIDEFVALGLVALLGAISPGPDFAIVTQQSLLHGRKGGIGASLGVSLGCLVHISYCILGIGVLISESVYLFNILKYVGGAYLIYLGIKGLLSKKATAQELAIDPINPAPISFWTAVRKGLFVNLLNPKVTLFILSIFTQMVAPDTPIILQSLMGLEFGLIGFIWFSFLTWMMTHPNLRTKLKASQHYIEKILGIFLILLGLRVAIL